MPNGLALRDCSAKDCYGFAYNFERCYWLKDVGWRVHHGWSAGDDQVDHTGKRTVGETYGDLRGRYAIVYHSDEGSEHIAVCVVDTNDLMEVHRQKH